MKKATLFNILLVCALVYLFLGGKTLKMAQALELSAQMSPSANPVGADFTYQGYLTRDGAPVNGICGLNFDLYDEQTLGTGNHISATQQYLNWPIANGRFTVTLDFGDVFLDDQLWLEVNVFCQGDSTSTTLPRQPVNATPYATNSDKLDGMHASEFQQTFDGGCPPGTSIRIIESNGAIFCENHDTRQTHIQTKLDASEYRGKFSSIAIGVDGLPIIAYADDYTGGEGHEDLRVAHCNDSACTHAEVTSLTPTGRKARQNAIAIGADGMPVIVFGALDGDDKNLYLLHCDDIACTSATSSTALGTYYGSGDISLIINAAGLPYFSFQNSSGGISIAVCGNSACSSVNFLSIDGGTLTGEYNSFTVNGNGLPVLFVVGEISTSDVYVIALRCFDSACSGWTDEQVGDYYENQQYISATTGNDGNPVIAWVDVTNSHLNVAHCTNPTCLTSAVYTIDTGSFSSPSISIGSDGFPVIVYSSGSNSDLKVAHCSDIACQNSLINMVNYSGDRPSLAIGSDGLPIFSFYSNTHYLFAEHCSNAFCIPYFRRR